jgi:hypothetical protein
MSEYSELKKILNYWDREYHEPIRYTPLLARLYKFFNSSGKKPEEVNELKILFEKIQEKYAEKQKDSHHVNSFMDDNCYTVQGLNQLVSDQGKRLFYCCHVCDSYGGKIGFVNLVNDLMGIHQYTPSCSIIGPNLGCDLDINDKDNIPGSIGFVCNYGFIYAANENDAFSDAHTLKDGRKVQVMKDRKDFVSVIFNLMYDPYCNYTGYNEVLINNWTPGAIFACKTAPWVISTLEWISWLLSFKKYVNGAYFFRKTELVPRYILKDFPVYDVYVTKKNPYECFDMRKIYDPAKGMPDSFEGLKQALETIISVIQKNNPRDEIQAENERKLLLNLGEVKSKLQGERKLSDQEKIELILELEKASSFLNSR